VAVMLAGITVEVEILVLVVDMVAAVVKDKMLPCLYYSFNTQY
jgi:hypothetical protein